MNGTHPGLAADVRRVALMGAYLPLGALVVPCWALTDSHALGDPDSIMFRLLFAVVAVPGVVLAVVLGRVRTERLRRWAVATALTWGVVWAATTIWLVINMRVMWDGVDAQGRPTGGMSSAEPSWGSGFVIVGIVLLCVAAVLAGRLPPDRASHPHPT